MKEKTRMLIFGSALIWFAFKRWEKKKKKSPVSDTGVMYDPYPKGTPVDQVLQPPATNVSVSHAPDCSIIAVAHGWWDEVAKPLALQMKGPAGDRALEIVMATVPACGEYATDAINEFLADVEANVGAWMADAAYDPNAGPLTPSGEPVAPKQLSPSGG